jgi:hypothetical protein
MRLEFVLIAFDLKHDFFHAVYMRSSGHGGAAIGSPSLFHT